MYQKQVKELMIPVTQYPCVSKHDTMFDAIVALKKANSNLPDGQKHFRAVLVMNKANKIVGKIGHISFLKALEPKYNDILDMEKLSRLALSTGYIDSLLEHYNLWVEDSMDLCGITKSCYCKDIMVPIEQRIEEDETIAQAIHKIIMWQTISLLVTRGKEIVGIIRVAEIYDSISDYVINHCEKN